MSLQIHGSPIGYPSPANFATALYESNAQTALQQTAWTFVKLNGAAGSKIVAFAANLSGGSSQLDSEWYLIEQARSRREAELLASKWRRLVLDPAAAYDADALTETVEPVFDAISRLGAGAIDLRNLSPEYVNGVHLAVVLRATLPMKELTPGWDEALQAAREALRRDQLDEEDALVGLI